ncbi:protein translocase subunit SecF [Photobacterium aphoticum]|uniref:Protein-export membrane protein SecF n=1 Tax=Photobacterium aphoticum TaxID=754436 RepID=A0A0J1GN21_9GAMM|nr:protein translocase subunit SecF [Photobacterium aphoticum]KLV01145.1 preprotein translocase subunit SecF [Photobacterium aphoticum]PSU55440.1 protein translocase subunit SecF [Photobacterium aphoticum]GHA49172.1 protein-export membrane protein SecF [Photobacterium aphoticum]
MFITMKNATKWRHFTSYVSVALMVISIGMIAVKGLNWGLDFTGGIVTEVQMNAAISSHEIDSTMDKALKQDVSVIAAGEPGRWVLRYAIPTQGEAPNIAHILQPLDGQLQVLNTSIVGPQVGQELADQGGLALLVSVLCILGYLSYRFEWRLASGSVFALAHDVIFILGFFAATQMEFNLTVLAAVLAIMGYSLNDSIIIADRIREVLIAKPNLSIQQVNNEAIAATFSRTMITSGTTLITVGALWLLGGGPLEGFSIAMFIGIMTGTWSSISVGTSLPELFGLNSSHYMPKPITEEP